MNKNRSYKLCDFGWVEYQVRNPEMEVIELTVHIGHYKLSRDFPMDVKLTDVLTAYEEMIAMLEDAEVADE